MEQKDIQGLCRQYKNNLRGNSVTEAEVNEAIANEAMAMAVGDKGQRIAENRSAFTQWLKNFWNTIRQAVGDIKRWENLTAREFMGMKWENFADGMAERILSGKELREMQQTDNKTSNIGQYRDLEDALDSITLNNTYFPEANQKVLSFGLDADGSFQIITEQPYITESNRKATQEEIDAFVEQLGFKKSTQYDIPGRYVDENALLNDLTPKNVILTPAGQIIPVDTIMHLNTPIWNEGGKRQTGLGIKLRQLRE